MIVPKPPMKLEGHCSVIHQNTLYAFSPNGFASIPLERNGNWSMLEPGESVSGAACVRAGIDGHTQEQALYVIGGTGSSGKYTGLQRYSFQSEKWETLTPDSPVTGNRTGHSAAYLKSSSSILMYAGTQKGSTTPSSDTFVIDTASPHTVSSYPADNASPASSPILLPWNDREIALVGGTRDSERIHIFKSLNPTHGAWRDSDITLAHTPPADVQCALLNRPDGSKILENFNMNASPNTVTSIVLLNAHGKPAKPGTIVGGSASRKRKRDGPGNNYPAYDDQFAPSTTRKDYSLAQGDNGLVVISSGHGTDSLAIFNQTSNAWVNTTKLFYGDKSEQQILGPTTTSLPTPTSSSTESSAPAGGNSDSDSGSSVGTIVGATVGSLVGALVILILLLLLLRRQRKKREAQAKDGSNDKDRLSFQDQGIEPLAQSAYPMAKSPVPMANSSVDSLAIFSGKVEGEKSPGALGPNSAYGQAQQTSPLSTVESSGNVTPGNDKAFEAEVGSYPGDRRTDEGWSKYFEDNGSATNLARMQSDRSVSSSELGSPGPKENAWPMKTLTPLNFGFLDSPKPLGQVNSGSPTTEHSPSGRDGRSLVIPEGQSARISSADSISVQSDDYDQQGRDYFPSTGAPSASEDAHLPRAAQRSWLGRPPSSTYSSAYIPSARETVTSNGRQSSVIIPDSLHEMPVQNNVNSDMSWLNLNADR